MEKLPMCRICLAENVRRYAVVNSDLHKLYEKLTDIPFVTEDSRPIFACFFCCAKLKQCYRLLRQCLDAEELFAQMMNEDYKPNPLINQDHLQFSSGFIKSPIEQISIVDECQMQNIAIKEELPAFCEGRDSIIEPKEERQSDELELENLDNSCLDVADEPPDHSESDLEEDVSLMEFKAEVEEHDVETIKLDPENLDNSCLDVADKPPDHSESDLEDYVPLIKFKTEVEEHEEETSTKIKCSISRRHLFELWYSQKPADRKKYVLEVFLASLKNVENVDIAPLSHRIVNLCRSLEKFWIKSARTKDRVLKNYSNWLDETECIELTRSVEQCHLKQEQPEPSRTVGRPRKDFSNLSPHSKRRRLAE